MRSLRFGGALLPALFLEKASFCEENNNLKNKVDSLSDALPTLRVGRSVTRLTFTGRFCYDACALK